MGQPFILPTCTRTLPDWVRHEPDRVAEPSCPAGTAAVLNSEFRGEYGGAEEFLSSFIYC